MKILVLSKRQYMNKDLIYDKYGRFWEIPFALSALGHNITGICLSYEKKNSGWIPDCIVKWKSINAGTLKIIGLLRYITEVFNQAKKCDVIWACSDSFYGVIGCFIGKLVKRPVVFDIYDNFEEFGAAKLPIMTKLYHWAIRESDGITCLSQSFKRLVLETYVENQYVTTIEFAIDKNLFRPLDKHKCRRILNLEPRKLIIGTAGALFKIREVPLLIDAFQILKRKNPDLLLALAGPRDFEIPRIEGIIDMGILPYEKVPIFLNALDIAVICYANDNCGKYCFPQRTREFMACDIPIVAANVGGLADIFANRPEWLFEAGDALSLAKIIEQRLTEKTTDYPHLPEWKDLAIRLEKVLLHVIQIRDIN